MTDRLRLEPSVQSTAEAQRRQATCTHVWEPYRALLWGYLPVGYRCQLCGGLRRATSTPRGEPDPGQHQGSGQSGP